MHTFVRSRTIDAIQWLSLATTLLTAGAIHADSTQEPEPAEPTPLEVKVSGARLSFVPVDITPRRRNARSETALLKKATAELSTTRSLAYRRSELPRGAYRLTVERQEPESWTLLVWPGEKSSGKKTGAQPEGEENGDPGDKNGHDPKPALRVPLTLGSAPSEDQRVLFELKSLDKGKRVQIVIRAGSTELRGALRWKTD